MANDYNGVDKDGSEDPQSINTNWIGEAWKLYTAHAGIWAPATAIAIFGPLVIDGYLVLATHTTHKLFGVGFEHPLPFKLAIGLFNLIFVVYMLNGLGNLAVRQVSGAPIVLSDVFSGSRNFGHTLVWCILVGTVLAAGTLLVVWPGVLVASLLIPSFALVASGQNVVDSINKSINASKSDKLNGKVVAFNLLLLLLAGVATVGLAFLVTLPIILLVSALAYRDLIGFPGRAAGPVFRPSHVDENKPDVVLDESVGVGPRVTLTGESLDEP